LSGFSSPHLHLYFLLFIADIIEIIPLFVIHSLEMR
jgi:hypothetical protein